MNSLTASRYSSAEVLNTFISMTLWLTVIPHGNIFSELRTDFELKKDYELKKNSNIFEKSLVVFEPTATESHYKSDTSYALTLLGSIQNNLELRSSSEFQFFLIWGFLKTSIDPIFFQHRPKNHTHVSHTTKSKKHPVKKKSGLTWSYLLLSMISIALL